MRDEFIERKRIFFDHLIELFRIEETNLRKDIGELLIVLSRLFLIAFDIDDGFKTISVLFDIFLQFRAVFFCPFISLIGKSLLIVVG